MKVYLKKSFARIQDTISKDQAYREFKALKIIGSHPNFLSLYSKELDDCLVRETGKYERMYEAWAIRFRHIEDSVPLDKFWINIGMVCLNKIC